MLPELRILKFSMFNAWKHVTRYYLFHMYDDHMMARKHGCIQLYDYVHVDMSCSFHRCVFLKREHSSVEWRTRASFSVPRPANMPASSSRGGSFE